MPKVVPFKRREIDQLGQLAADYGAKGMAWIVVTENELKSPITKFLSDQEIEQIMSVLKPNPETYCFLPLISRR